MIALLTGGCKQGKSTHAEGLALMLAKGGRAVYLATMEPCDQEDRDRIARHVAGRAGKGFVTVEQARAIELADVEPGDSVLLDSTTALLANEMFGNGMDGQAGTRVWEGLLRLSVRVRNLVVVSDGIHSDAALYDEWTERYRAALAEIDRALALRADIVAEAHAGCLLLYKGEWPCGSCAQA